MIVLYTDFGARGPYVGQMQAVLAQMVPWVPHVELMNDAPCFSPLAAGRLLAALVDPFPKGTVFCCVVDPGVGSSRRAIWVEAGGRLYVGPDNGLLVAVLKQDPEARVFEIEWRPERMSASFHGRDLFAPVAAMLASGQHPEHRVLHPEELVGSDQPEQLSEIIYIDPYGNAMTGLVASKQKDDLVLIKDEVLFRRMRTFSDVAPGEAFCYENACGLIEIAVNQGSAAQKLGLEIGSQIEICP